MAYAALVSLKKTIDLILNYHQDSVSPELENQLKSIHKHAISLQAFLEDFPDKANSLEGRITEATHLAEDIIELFMWEQTYKSLNPSHDPLCAPPEHQPWGRYGRIRNDFHELEKVTNKIGSIIIRTEMTEKQKDLLVGFDHDLIQIKYRLCGQSSKLEIIPIVGMGGLGKTTLARNVYDDPLIVERFDVHAWITVSQDYSVSEIVSSLLVSMKVLDSGDHGMRDWLEDVHIFLSSRRYLIVLDDVWDKKAWDDLKMLFQDFCNGSRIILTTRLSEVASYANSCGPLHEMQFMNDHESWNLLRQKVFKQHPCPAELEYIGKKIARSCRGLPLAIVLISGILSTVDQTEAAWSSIAKNVNSAISAEGYDNILALCYTNLPHHLRPCLLYMGVFPEDYEIRVSKLIKLWVAEGFLKPNGSRSYEETAKEYLEDLVNRSLVLVTKRKCDGRIKSVSLHDILRDMCIRRAHEENFILHVGGLLREGIKTPRRLSVSHSVHRGFLESFYGSTIRTIICLEHRLYGTGCCLGYFRLLRVLDLPNAYEFFFCNNDDSFSSLPPEVFELFHLRYLAFYFHFNIPPAMSNLQNLQTLIIHTNSKVELPVEVWRMPQLRHIIVLSCVLPSQEGTAFALGNLQTLSRAVNFVCCERILKLIPNLKKLGIAYTARRDDEKDYQLHNLMYLQQLEDLKIEVHGFPLKQRRVCPAFPRTLKKLTLTGPELPWEDMEIVGSLPDLEVLKLRDNACIGDTWETTEGEFSHLKFLLIDELELQYWITESSHFPRLQCLVLRRCWYLSEIPEGIGEVPTLALIEVDDCNEPLVISAKQIQEEQLERGNDILRVRLVHERS